MSGIFEFVFEELNDSTNFVAGSRNKISDGNDLIKLNFIVLSSALFGSLRIADPLERDTFGRAFEASESHKARFELNRF